ncbi:MAG: hypothetical protein ACRDZW_02030 [Acidimicrobiales bacterium]
MDTERLTLAVEEAAHLLGISRACNASTTSDRHARRAPRAPTSVPQHAVLELSLIDDPRPGTLDQPESATATTPLER